MSRLDRRSARHSTGQVYYPREFWEYVAKPRDLTIWDDAKPETLSALGLKAAAILIAAFWIGVFIVWLLP